MDQEMPGLVEYRLRDKEQEQQFQRMLEEYQRRMSRQTAQEPTQKRDDPAKQKSEAKSTQRIRIFESKQVKQANKEVTKTRVQQEEQKEEEVELPQQEHSLIEQLLSKFNYSAFNKQLVQINEDNTRRLIEAIEVEKQKIEQNIRKMSENSLKEKKSSKYSHEIEEERKRIRDFNRLKALYEDKLVLKLYIQDQHRVIHKLSKQFIDLKLRINDTVDQFSNGTKNLPKQNERLQRLLNENKQLRQERDRQSDLRRQLEEDVSKRVNDFHMLYQQALLTKTQVGQQLKILMFHQEVKEQNAPEEVDATEPKQGRIAVVPPVLPLKKVLNF